MNYSKVVSFLEKIFEYLIKTDISYKKSFPKDNDSVYSNDYPHKNFWIDYLKIGRKFFKKSENYNMKGTVDSESSSSNKITEFKIITNEMAIIFEENEFIENIIAVLVTSSFNLRQIKSFKLSVFSLNIAF